MRKFFMIVGIVAVIAILGGGVGVFVLARNGAALDSASKAYTEASVPAIAANWDVDALWKRASPALRKVATRDQIEGMFIAAKQALGPMVEYRGSRGQAMMGVNNTHPVVSAQYVASARFQKGAADFRVGLVKIGDDWMIQGFHIDSPALMQRLVGTKS
jgi:hypothetical protein